jgi:hypothetical protein
MSLPISGRQVLVIHLGTVADNVAGTGSDGLIWVYMKPAGHSDFMRLCECIGI